MSQPTTPANDHTKVFIQPHAFEMPEHDESSSAPARMFPHRIVDGKFIHPYQSDEGYQAFCDLQYQEGDIVALSYPKCGTTFLHKVLFLLTRVNEDGELDAVATATDINVHGQLYLDWMHKEKGTPGPFPHVCIDDMLQQPSPRLFLTHLPPNQLPESLNQHPKCKIVTLLRNPKDAYVSFHHFVRSMAPTVGITFEGQWRGTPKFQGTYDHYLPQDDAYAPGTYLEYLRDMQKLADSHDTDEMLVLYYEELLSDFDSNLTKLAEFLGIPLTQAKRETVTLKCSFSSMKAAAKGSPKEMLVRKGVAGDWMNHVDTTDTEGHATPSAAQFERFDTEMAKIAHLEIVKPLMKWMHATTAPPSA